MESNDNLDKMKVLYGNTYIIYLPDILRTNIQFFMELNVIKTE